jgi:hypothetical protein
MKTILFAGCAVLLAASLSGCAGLPGAGGGTDWAKAAMEIAKDPACAHTDILDIMVGPVPSGHVHLERSGCKTGAPIQPSAPLAVGTVVAPAPPVQ